MSAAKLFLFFQEEESDETLDGELDLPNVVSLFFSHTVISNVLDTIESK